MGTVELNFSSKNIKVIKNKDIDDYCYRFGKINSIKRKGKSFYVEYDDIRDANDLLSAIDNKTTICGIKLRNCKILTADSKCDDDNSYCITINSESAKNITVNVPSNCTSCTINIQPHH